MTVLLSHSVCLRLRNISVLLNFLKSNLIHKADAAIFLNASIPKYYKGTRRSAEQCDAVFAIILVCWYLFAMLMVPADCSCTVGRADVC